MPPRVEAALLMAKTAYGSHTSQSSLRPLAKARRVSPRTPLTRSALAFVFLWYAEPISRLDPMRRVNSLNNVLVNLGSWSTTSTSGTPSPDRSAISRMMRAASAAVSVVRVGTAWTFPDRWST